MLLPIITEITDRQFNIFKCYFYFQISADVRNRHSLIESLFITSFESSYIVNDSAVVISCSSD